MRAEKPSYLIGQAAALSGVTPANIRFYERSGLLATGGRGANSYRRYDERDVHQLRFIRLCRAMDMSLEEVRTLLALDLSRKDEVTLALRYTCRMHDRVWVQQEILRRFLALSPPAPHP